MRSVSTLCRTGRAEKADDSRRIETSFRVISMALPLSPAIDADVCDEDIFDSPADKQAVGFGGFLEGG